MRAAAILGPGSSIRDLKPFEAHTEITWTLGLPAPDVADVILIFGGDGTVHRHLGALVKLALPVLVVPQGSGNDFARALGIRSVVDALQGWQSFFSRESTPKTVDLGIIAPWRTDRLPSETLNHEVSSVSKHYFCCVAGVGLDAAVTRLANRLPRLVRAHGGYALSLPVALAQFHACQLTILQPSDTDSSVFTQRYSQPALLAAIANTQSYGGGMRIAPRASLTDGLLDVCTVGKLPKLKLLSLFPTVYMGRHLGIKKIDYFQVPRIRVKTVVPMDVYADGEYVCQTPIEVSVASEALSVIVPAESKLNGRESRTNAIAKT